jgi:hypothetical protein
MKKTMFLFFAFMLSGCISIIRFEYEETGVLIDHSFNAAGNVVETGRLTYIKEPFFFWQKKANPLEGGISVSGKFRRLSYSPSKVIMWTRPNENETFFIGPWHVVYQWNGAITFDGKTEPAELFFHAYSSDKNGSGKSFEYSGNPVSVRIGIKGVATDVNKQYMELRSFPVEIVTDFPCLLGNLMTEQNTYKLSMTKEVEYRLTNASELPDEEVDRKYGFFEKEENRFSNLFYRQNQKFQAVDSNNAVVAEICDDVYTLYDTLPEQELPAVKRDIAWFYAYRHLTKYLNSFSGWDIPLF